MADGGEDRLRRASLIARDDQQTAAMFECETSITYFCERAMLVADEMVAAGIPSYMVVSQLTGVVATALHQHFGGEGPPE